MANDGLCVKHEFNARPMTLVFFYFFRAALAAVQLLTWSCSAGVSPGVLGGFELENLCAAAAWVLPDGRV